LKPKQRQNKKFDSGCTIGAATIFLESRQAFNFAARSAKQSEKHQTLKQSVKAGLIILLVLIVDQVVKLWVKTNMHINEDSFLHWGWPVSWARIHFVENPGMAFGLELDFIPGGYGKLMLSLFRIVAVGFLFYYLRLLLKAKISFGLIVCFSLILAGAVGNIIDSAVYGQIFSASPYHGGGAATLFPEDGGYAGFLHGKVVDMFYFPMIEGTFPDWFPLWAGEDFLFFRPVFNVADASITVGVLSLLLFHRNFFSGNIDDENESKEETETDVEEASVSNETETGTTTTDTESTETPPQP